MTGEQVPEALVFGGVPDLPRVLVRRLRPLGVLALVDEAELPRFVQRRFTIGY
ncbi:hypothetical protein OG730_38900 [Streptomyces sp. NBC_01298]|uniref:hypothetical protein n=1 Tax=Streptomyces sp. NBC_01298 TaxID=2903817 RepID=UPI002E1391B0|nr:hypothetical protein OG730_38900 [Streptomyces sp. NBC_01298]